MPALIYWVYLQNVYTFFYKQPRIIFSSGITRGHDHDWHFPLKEPCKSFRFCQVCSIWFHTFSCLHSQVCIIWVREAVTACQSQPAIMAPQYVLMSSSFRTEWPLSCSGLRCFVCSALTIFQSSDWKKKCVPICGEIENTHLMLWQKMPPVFEEKQGDRGKPTYCCGQGQQQEVF